MTILVSIDPGAKKCGLVLVDSSKSLVLQGKVVDRNFVYNVLKDWQLNNNFELILLGNGTSSHFWKNSLKDLAPIELIEEKGSTLKARKRYWQLWPLAKWMNWVPKGLFLPPGNMDAIAALILVEDYLQKELIWIEKPDFRILHEQ